MGVSENLHKLTSAFKSVNDEQGALRLGVELAQALGWNEQGTRLEQISVRQRMIHLTRAYLGDQPAVIFLGSPQPSNAGLLNRVAFYAYHSNVQWCVLANPHEATIFNSHWLRNNEWYQLPPISWDNFEADIDLFEAITPDGLASGQIDRLATEFYEPDKFLLPVDEMLVDRLDYWRDESIRHADSPKQVDEKLQTLFAQLFILRAIEDRNLIPRLPRLLDAVDRHGEADLSQLHLIFQEAKERIQSELFEQLVFDEVPLFISGGIIQDLYFPHSLPQVDLQYNFAWISSDILGSAYERYLSNLLAPAPLKSAQLKLWDQPLRSVERTSVRKASGVYYTPSFLVHFLTEKALDEYFSTSSRRQSIPRVADFSCGSGSFLTAAVDSLIRRLRASDPDRNWGREIIDRRRIIGVDNDRRAVTLARLSLWLRLAEEPDPLPLPRLQEVIIHGDSLTDEINAQIPTGFDIVLGNPPFLATGKFPRRDQLAARFETAHGRFDYSYLFVELAVKKLEDHGVLGMVVPNRLFRNRDAGTLRRILADKTNIKTVFDFGSTEVFSGTNAYIGAIVAERSQTPADGQEVRVVNIRDLPSRFAGAMLMRADGHSGEFRNDYMVAYSTTHPSGDDIWLLLSPAARAARIRIEQESEPLATIAGIYQGIKTGANDVFIVEVLSHSGPLAEVRNGLGDKALIETSLLHPTVYGSEIKRYDLIQAGKFILYPYRARGTIPEPELRQRFPSTYKYLSQYRSLLANRSSIRGRQNWYELTRRRDEQWLNAPKLMIRDLANEASFALDKEGSVYLVGGTAVIPADQSNLLPLLGYLNSSLVNWYLSQITPSFQSGFQKFEPRHMSRVPVLNSVLLDEELNDSLNHLANCVIEAKGMGESERQDECEKQIDRVLANQVQLDVGDIR